MKSCEEYEIDLSSLLDGELSAADAASALEHALACADCGAFYRTARRLQSALPPQREVATPATVQRSWDAVLRRAAAEERPAVVAPRFAAPRWLRAAALVALGLGGGYLLSSLGGAPLPAATDLPTAGAAAPAMNERRFVAVADELLRADARYQRAMLEVLRLVPALETGEGLGGENGEPRTFVRTTTRDERRNREL